MARSTCHLLDQHLLASVTEGHTIISGFNVGIRDVDPGRPADMDPVGIQAILRCIDGNLYKSHILAVYQVHVKKFAIQWAYALDQWIRDRIEPKILFGVARKTNKQAKEQYIN